MTEGARLDVLLVRRGLARSRRHAHDLVRGGLVSVQGRTASRPGHPTRSTAPIEVESTPGYVSRSAGKLAGALTAFTAGGPRVAGRRALDAGASTGGFTEVLLGAGAAEVAAVDVGRGQLAPALREHRAVSVHERTDIRNIGPDDLGGPVDLVVADLSFISLTLVLPALVGCAGADADFVLLVKPQFEVGRDGVSAAGVVRTAESRAHAVTAVAEAARRLGLGTRGLVEADPAGAHGNAEYLLWLHSHGEASVPDLVRDVVRT